jgi:tetratricopeptide (TPR) repeat protein
MTKTPRLLGPYYYGQNKWDNYLLDIQETVASGNAAREQGLRLQSDSLAVAHEHIEHLRQQSEQLRNFEEALRGGLEDLRAEFEWGFTLMVDRMETQIDHLSQIAERLDAIHRTLQSPLLTQAREFFQLGQAHFRKGLLDKSLAAFLKAEEKNDVDFLLQLQIGKLFLYGRDEDDDVIDLPLAEKHLLLAARYADAEKGTFPQWNEYCGQAYFHAGVAAYLIGEQEQAAGNSNSRRMALQRALSYLAKAVVLWPRFTETIYTQAKCHALLGQTQEALKQLEILSDKDRRYFAKSTRDGDFEALRVEIEEMFRSAIISPGPLARATELKLAGVAEAEAWARRSAPVAADDLATIELMSGKLRTARLLLPSLDVDIEDLSHQLSQMITTLEKLAQRELRKNLDISQSNVAVLEGRREYYEDLTEHARQAMKATSGAGAGLLSAGLAFFLLTIAVAIFLSNLPRQNSDNAAFYWAGLVGCVVVGFGASKLWRNHKNRPHQRQINYYARTLDDCERTLAASRAQANGWREAMRTFVVWQARRSSPPPL